MTNDLLIEAHLKRLRLPAIGRVYRQLAREAETSNQTYEHYLLALLDQEIQQREENVQRSRVRSARFPVVKTLDQFDFSLLPDLNSPRILQLAAGEYLTRHENVIFIGPNGTGKTHLAIGLALCACRQGKRVRFVTAPSLVNELLEARKDYRLSRIEAYYQKLDLLVIDELGFVPFAREAAELLFGVCAGRYERRSTLITSNLEFSRWTEVLGEASLAGALVDRLTHHAHIVHIVGDSFRFRHSLSRAAGETGDGNAATGRRRKLPDPTMDKEVDF